jgi:hypothetical protein
MILRISSDYFLNRINRLVFVMETQYFYEIEIGFVSAICMKFWPQYLQPANLKQGFLYCTNIMLHVVRCLVCTLFKIHKLSKLDPSLS